MFNYQWVLELSRARMQKGRAKMVFNFLAGVVQRQVRRLERVSQTAVLRRTIEFAAA